MEAKVILNLHKDGLITQHDPSTFEVTGTVFVFERKYLAQDKNLSDEQREVVETILKWGNRPIPWSR